MAAPSAAVSVAERFLTELQRRPRSVAAPLPDRYQPLANAIVGPGQRVKVAADASTRQALRVVGKRAATVDDTIHLDLPPGAGPRDTEIIAHELTHVAHPSPQPRFFDDERRGPEELMAERVAGIMARSPVMGHAVQRRVEPTPAGPRAGRPGSNRRTAPALRDESVSASALAEMLSRREPPTASQPSAGLPGAASRQVESRISRSFSGPAPSQPVVARANQQGLVRRAKQAPSSTDDYARSLAESAKIRDFEDMLERSLDFLVHRIEDRLLVELERRGGQHWRNM
jgi:hypothetical protein